MEGIRNGVVECLEKGFDNRATRIVPYVHESHGRELFTKLRTLISSSESGASLF